ncbi:MAG: PQQ-dependent sugar dehydrogenase [Nocardioidaceae bacterium]
MTLERLTPTRSTTIACAAVLACFLTACTGPEEQSNDERPSDPGTVTVTETLTKDTPTIDENDPVRVTDTIATDLEAPWGLGFLPDGTALVTQRDRGIISLIDGASVRKVGTIDETAPTSEGGLLGLAVSPDFATDRQVFVYVTTLEDNRVLSMRFDGSSISDITPILTGIPNGDIHDGGRLAFGPDGFLYVSTGETGDEDLSQDDNSLGGKILRITPEGDPASGNPDEQSPVWTAGHRNVQGLAFDDQDRLWASEFGSQVWDELNRIEPGNNYGWPLAEGDSNLEGYVDPQVQWSPAEASPSSVAFADESLWVASLRGERLWQVAIKADGTLGRPVPHFVGAYGRLRTVVAAPDGSLWLGTSNRDGRGDPAPTDDRIFRVTVS